MTYQLTPGGGIIRSSDGLSIPADLTNQYYRDYLAWLNAGNSPAPAEGPAEPDYREQRAAAYVAQLSAEGTFQTSVGDLFDAVIKAIYGDRSDLDRLAATIQQIKAEFPKPEG